MAAAGHSQGVLKGREIRYTRLANQTILIGKSEILIWKVRNTYLENQKYTYYYHYNVNNYD